MKHVRPSRDEVMELAVAMHARDEAAAPLPGADPAAVAAELGIPPDYLVRAEAELVRRRATQMRRRRLGSIVAAAALALGLGYAGVSAILTTPPAEPWSASVEVRRSWALDVSPGTLATLRVTDEAERGPVAAVEVGRAQPRDDGTWFVNLDGPEVALAPGHHTLAVEMAGTLPAARVFLEASADERWRSPPVAVRPDWTPHRLKLVHFEHQRRVGGRWEAGGGGPPTGEVTVSVKLGHFVNPPEATGTVRVASVAVE